MEEIIDLLKYTIPSVVVFAITYYMMKTFFEREKKLKQEENRALARKDYIPLRIQAYERAALYLERIDPNNLIMRVHTPGMSANRLHGELLKNIREEYNHNMVQQIYMSQRSWSQLKMAKEESIKIINMAAQQMSEHATGVELSSAIFEIVAKLEKLPTEIALEKVKADFQKGMA
ncbi:DUF7935 family protein [Parvicella tangerina]|uniref:Uncharacterized protein n=1 Tax=Parvicella tangerina TaxID=2829795 RepID=A0A916NT00_9FLAO|nr:hypothetical protein [Parvicella tangerina]CAG5084944.1 hypothetical protein CRYO30217_02606 [Parvicella tangerina]